MAQRATDLSSLTDQQLSSGYKSLAALLKDKELSEIDSTQFDNLDRAQQESYLKLQLKHLDARNNQFRLTEDDKGQPEKESPRDRLAGSFKNTDPAVTDSIAFHVAVLNGFENPTQENYDDLGEFYQGDGSTLENRQGIVTNFNNQAADQAQEAAIEATRQRAAEYELGIREDALAAKSDLLGYNPYDTSMTTPIQVQLSRHSEEIYGQESNVYIVDQALRAENIDVAEATVDFALDNNDTREIVLSKLYSGDEAQIIQAQQLLGVEGTGEMNLETAEAALAQLEDANGLGTNYYMASNGQISNQLLEQNLENGVIPIIKEALPDDLQSLADTDMGIEAIAMHLSDKENFDAYSNHLKTEHSAQLEATYGADIKTDIAKYEASMTRIEITEMAAQAAADTPRLAEEQEELADTIEEAGLSATDELVYDSLDDGLIIDENTPDKLVELAQLRQGIIDAEQNLNSYRLSPVTINQELNIVGAVGAPYGPYVQKLENEITTSQNEYLDSVANITDEQRQEIATYLKDAKPEIYNKHAADLENQSTPTQEEQPTPQEAAQHASIDQEQNIACRITGLFCKKALGEEAVPDVDAANEVQVAQVNKAVGMDLN